ncbi:MAG: phage tail tube protein [Oscillospiraceae bacterium]|jgi:hypothetical protein|nr:phage tail tube protein [Oscillospiraceae bacterium]
MAGKKYNERPISLREGKMFIDGDMVADNIKALIKFTPETWTGGQLGKKQKSTRWLGCAIAGSMTRRRTTTFLADAIKKYLETGETPEFTIQGIMDDANSDYYDENGTIVTTCLGCVLTGDLTLISLDTKGEVLEDEIAFNVYDIV